MLEEEHSSYLNFTKSCLQSQKFMLRETKDKTIEDYNNTSGQRVLSSNIGMNNPITTTNLNSRPSSTMSFETIHDGVDEDDNSDDIPSTLEDTSSPESIDSGHTNTEDFHTNKEFPDEENPDHKLKDFKMEPNLLTRPSFLLHKPGREALKSMAEIMDTNSIKSLIPVGDIDEFPCGFINEDFDKDILSPTTSEKIQTSYNDLTSSLQTPFTSLELAKDELFMSKELKNLFAYTKQFKPQDIIIGTNLKPFFPNYIQALGSVDEFIKVSRPDGQFSNLGLKVLDEDGPKQSDPAILTLHIYSTSIQSNSKPFKVVSIENVEKNSKKLDSWIASIKDLHRSKPPPSVLFSKSMPDVDKLKEVWPIQLEKILDEIELPSAELEVDLATFIDIYCSIFDIPVYQNKVEALHVLFMLYLDLKNQTHHTSLSTYWLNS